jgi:hypothetical protein
MQKMDIDSVSVLTANSFEFMITIFMHGARKDLDIDEAQ